MSTTPKILIVDDRKENLLALRGVLTDLDAEVIEANNGNDALAATLRHDFALALLDVQMPGMDGYELATLLRGAPGTQRLPIVFLTAAYGEKEQVFKGYEAGAVDYLVKPYDPQMLLSKARVFLELHRAKHALAEQVAALAASEERYRNLVMTIPDIVYHLDHAGRFTFLNDAVRKLGYTPKELIGQSFSSIVLLTDVDVACHGSPLGGMRQCTACEGRLVPKPCKDLTSGEASPLDSAPITVEVNSTALYAPPSGKEPAALLGSVGVLRDISERKRADAELRAAIASAVRANEAKSRFLAAASHDLRQPLSALTMYASLLVPRSPSERKVVASMKDSIGSLTGLLTDLLDMSKLDAGVVIPNIDDFPIAETLASLESANMPEAQVKGLQLRCAPSRLTARCDPVLYQRILGNLVANAIRYTEHGGVLVACRRRQGKTWVEVWDTGIGIPADKTAEIFEEFKQLGDGARNKGSGLGLAIVAKTAAVLGIEVNVRSRPGRGSVFAVELPLGIAAPAEPVSVPAAVAPRTLRIALVDDNPMVRSALDVGLQSLGYQVVAADGRAKLLEKLGTLTLDIVVSDYRLAQGETGFDVITAARTRLGAELPAILITGDTDPKVVRSMTERGIAVLHKPLELDTLQSCIENLVCQVT